MAAKVDRRAERAGLLREPGSRRFTDLATQRLHNHYITRPAPGRPEEVVSRFGAVQAQEYPAARWALALRMPPTTDKVIERACDEGRILRTHVMRPTWHFVAQADIRWMLALTAPRVHRVVASYMRNLGIDGAVPVRATAVFERALRDGQHLTRAELGARLARARPAIALKGTPLAVLTIYAELEGVICSGTRCGSQLTYALLAERAPRARLWPRDEALAELTRRYFMSHGPATVRDFVWWSGLTTADVKRGLEMNRARQEVVGGRTYWCISSASAGRASGPAASLLPIYDEYLVAYRDRDAAPHQAFGNSARAGGAHLQPSVVIRGRIAGTWKTVREPGALNVCVTSRGRLTGADQRAVEDAVARYGRFLGAPVSLSFEGQVGSCP